MNFLGCGSTHRLDRQLNNATGFQDCGICPRSGRVERHQRGRDTFTFSSGDKALLTKSGVGLKAAGSEKLSNAKK